MLIFCKWFVNAAFFLKYLPTFRRFTKLRIFNTFVYKYKQILVSKITNSDKSQAPQFRETAVSGCPFFWLINVIFNVVVIILSAYVINLSAYTINLDAEAINTNAEAIILSAYVINLNAEAINTNADAIFLFADAININAEAINTKAVRRKLIAVAISLFAEQTFLFYVLLFFFFGFSFVNKSAVYFSYNSNKYTILLASLVKGAVL